jgi:hypothetical protein
VWTKVLPQPVKALFAHEFYSGILVAVRLGILSAFAITL